MKLGSVIPSKGKGKILLFVKLSACSITKSNIHNEITVLELGANPFEHLELLANEVFLPVLSNPDNQAKWGEVPTREILDRFHNFLSSTTILCGQIKGETRLPMPPIDLSGGPSTGELRCYVMRPRAFFFFTLSYFFFFAVIENDMPQARTVFHFWREPSSHGRSKSEVC